MGKFSLCFTATVILDKSIGLEIEAEINQVQHKKLPLILVLCGRSCALKSGAWQLSHGDKKNHYLLPKRVPSVSAAGWLAIRPCASIHHQQKLFRLPGHGNRPTITTPWTGNKRPICAVFFSNQKLPFYWLVVGGAGASLACSVIVINYPIDFPAFTCHFHHHPEHCVSSLRSSWRTWLPRWLHIIDTNVS